MKPYEDFIPTCVCQHCDKHFFDGEGVRVNKHTNQREVKLVFCSEMCASEFYLEKLRKLEGQ